MPGKRSAYNLEWDEMSEAQRRRFTRDSYYRSAHSAPGKKFVEVEAAEATAVKDMARARSLHSLRDSQNGSHSHYARNASLKAMQSGLIDSDTLKEDQKIYRRGNEAKHGQRSWADMSESVDDANSPLRDVTATLEESSKPDTKAVIRKYIAELESKVSGAEANVTQLQQLVEQQNGTIAILLKTIENYQHSPQPVPLLNTTMSGERPATIDELRSLDDKLSKAIDKLSEVCVRVKDVEAMERSLSETCRKCIEDVRTTSDQSFASLNESIPASLAEVLEEHRRTYENKFAEIEVQIEDIRSARFSIPNAENQLSEIAASGKLVTPSPGHDFLDIDEWTRGDEDCCGDHDDSEPPEPPGRCSREPVWSDVDVDPWCIGDAVRLYNLKADSFNGKAGVIVSYDKSSGRYGVKLHGGPSASTKAFKPDNLCQYWPSETDICTRCGDLFDLNDFPVCACEGSPSLSGASAKPFSSPKSGVSF